MTLISNSGFANLDSKSFVAEGIITSDAKEAEVQSRPGCWRLLATQGLGTLAWTLRASWTLFSLDSRETGIFLIQYMYTFVLITTLLYTLESLGD